MSRSNNSATLPIFQNRLPEAEYVPSYAYKPHVRHGELVKEFVVQMVGACGSAATDAPEVPVSKLLQDYHRNTNASVNPQFQKLLEKAFDLVFQFVSNMAEKHKDDFRDVARATACVGEIRKILDVHGKTLRETFPQYVAADNEVETENNENSLANSSADRNKTDTKGGVVSIPRDAVNVKVQNDGRFFTLPESVRRRLKNFERQQASSSCSATTTIETAKDTDSADAKRLRLDSLPSSSGNAGKATEKTTCNCFLLEGVTPEKVYSLVGPLTRPGTTESVSMEGFGTAEEDQYAASTISRGVKNDPLLPAPKNLAGPPSHAVTSPADIGIRAFMPPKKDYLRLFHGINYCDALQSDKRDMLNNPMHNWIDSEIVSGDIYAGSSRMVRELFVNIFRNIMLLFARFETDMENDPNNWARVANGLSLEELRNARALFCLCFPVSEYFMNDYASFYHGWTLKRLEEKDANA